MQRRPEPERLERFGTHPEPCTDRDGVGRNAVAVDQLDRHDVALVARDDAPDDTIDDVHPGVSQHLDLRVISIDAVMEHQGEPRTQLTEQASRVQSDRMGDDLDDASVAYFEPVTERAVDDIAAPVVGEAVDLGEFVDQTGGGKHPSGEHRGAPDEFDAEAVLGACHVDDAAVEHLASIAANLFATDPGELPRRKPLVAEVAMHPGSRGVPWFPGIDNDDGAALAHELERCGESGGRSADDGHVAVAFDGAMYVFTHRSEDTLVP